MYMKGVIWVNESMNFQWVEDSFCMDVIFQVELTIIAPAVILCPNLG